MSYRVTIDGDPFCSSDLDTYQLLNPKVVLEVNKAGSFTFTMLPDHPYYNSIEFRQSLFDVYQNDELIFEGVPVSEQTDFWNRKTVTCEGELTFLNDTIQRQAVYQNQTVASLLGEYLTVHNAQADATKQFALGMVTVSGGNAIYRFTNYNSTMQELQDDLIQNFGGYFRVRHDQGVRYLDYLASSPHSSSQTIRIGQNLADLSRNLSSLDICTVLIPLGAKTGNQVIDGLDERLDISSVNGGLDYLVGTAQAYFGNVWKTKVWDEVTTASALKQKGEDYLDDVQWSNLVISATAFDLGLADDAFEQFHVLDTIKVVSDPHGIDRFFLLSKLDIDLDHPANTKITLGQDTRLSLSAKSAQLSQVVERQPVQIMVDASENARQILDSATDGAIQILYNQNGVAYEMRINNSQDPSTATKWWRYNAGGWAYTDDGGQTYTVAATMDGTIYANLIKAGTLQSVNGKYVLNCGTGEVVMKFGEIGGWSINDDTIFKDVTFNNVPYQVGLFAPDTPLDYNTAFYVGYQDNGTWVYPFRVTYGGKVVANDIDITGGTIALQSNTAGDSRILLRGYWSSATHQTYLAPDKVVAYYSDEGGTERVGAVYPDELYIYEDSAHFKSALVSTDGLRFEYDNTSLFYPAQQVELFTSSTVDATSRSGQCSGSIYSYHEIAVVLVVNSYKTVLTIPKAEFGTAHNYVTLFYSPAWYMTVDIQFSDETNFSYEVVSSNGITISTATIRLSIIGK